jgi:hypothetical protein
MKKFFGVTYRYFLTIPDRLYPFAVEIEGKRVRGLLSYEAALKRALDTYGLGRMGYKLTLYREVFHFIGSIIFIAGSTLLSNNLFGSEAALYALFIAAVLALSYQEFYLHPRRFGQHAGKGVVDWLVWVIPMVLYLSFFR